MARLEYEITGNISGLNSAAQQVKGILNNLQNTADQLKIKLFAADTEAQINGIGGALQIVNGKIKEYLNNATKGSQAFKDQQTAAILDNLATRLDVVNGNAQIFGATVKNSQQAISAYQGAISSLLANGLSPLDTKITGLKTNIDGLTATIQQQQAAAAAANATPPVAPRALGLIEEAELKIRGLGTAIRQSQDTNAIARFTQQLEYEKQQLKDLQSIGTLSSRTVSILGNAFRHGTTAGLTPFGLQLGYVLQDLPYAAQNFGAVGNNLAQLVPTYGSLIAQSRALIEANGGVVNSSSLLKTSFTSLFTGINGVLLGVSLAISAFTIFQAVQQKNAREAENNVNALQKQKKALDDYLSTLSASQQVEAAAVNNYAKETVELDQLYNALKNNQNARVGAASAFDLLQEKWPAEFGNLQKGINFLSQLNPAYEKLRNNIIAVGTAAAASQLVESAQKEVIRNTVALNQATADRTKALNSQVQAQAQLAKVGTSYSVGGTAGTSTTFSNAQAKAYDNLLRANEALDAANAKITTYSGALGKASKQAQQYADAGVKAQERINASVVSQGRIKALEGEIKRYQGLRDALGDAAGLNAQQDAQRIQYNSKIKSDEEELEKLRGKTTATTNQGLHTELNIRQQIADLINRGLESATTSGLSEYAKQVQEIRNEYINLNRELDKAAAKSQAAAGRKNGISSSENAANQSQISAGRSLLGFAENKKLTDAALANEQKYQQDLQSIDDTFGIKKQESLNKEIAANKEHSDKLIAQYQTQYSTLTQLNDRYEKAKILAGGNPDKLAAAKATYNADVQASKEAADKIQRINADSAEATDAIRMKYAQKAVDIIGSIRAASDQAEAALGDKEESRTAKIAIEWEKRRAAANGYFNDLRKIYPEMSGQIGAYQSQVNQVFDKAKFQQISESLSRNFYTAMQSGISEFTNSFYSALTGIGRARADIDTKYNQQIADATDESTKRQIENLRSLEQQTTTSFGAVFSSIISSTLAAFNKSLFDGFVKSATENIGRTIIKPTDDQLGIKQSGIEFSGQVTSAGESFLATIQAAATALSLKLGTGGAAGLAGASGTGVGALAASVAGTAGVAGAALQGGAEGAAESISISGDTAGSSMAQGGASAAASITSAGGKLSAKVAGAAAALSVAGGLVSGFTKPTSYAGQAIGGALSGAGTGALLGSVVPGVGTVAGAIVGGVVGAVGGLFSASKARKQEELQQQQLQEQQKTNALLERQNAVAYTSSIIGRMTTSGIITGADVNAFGELKARVSGKDLEFVLGRASGR